MLQIADRILAIAGLVALILLCSYFSYEYGREEGRVSVKCSPKVHRMIYSAEEHFRAGRAMRRMEAVK
jgi:hypothetical protein